MHMYFQEFGLFPVSKYVIFCMGSFGQKDFNKL